MSDQELPSDDGSGLPPAQLWFKYRRYPYLLAKLVFWGTLFFGGGWMMQSMQNVLFPLLVSLLIAYLLDPTIDWIEGKGISRTVAILMVIATGVIGMTLFSLVLYPTIATQAVNVSERLPELLQSVETEFVPWFETTFKMQLPENLSAMIAEYGATIRESVPNIAKKISAWIGGMLGAVGPIIASLVNLIMIPVFTFYFLRDFDRYREALVDYIPTLKKDLVMDRARKADEVVGAWFRGQLEVAGILAGLYGVGLGALFGFIGIGTVSGVAIGILTGLLNIIPYFGVFVGFVLSVLIVFIDWHGWGPVVGVGVVFMIIQILEGYVITPRIVGEKVGLSPVVVIIVLLLGGELFGLMGILLAIPVAGIIRVLLPDIFAAYLTSPFFTGEYDHPGFSILAADGPTEDQGGYDSLLVSLETAPDLVHSEDHEHDDPQEAEKTVASEKEEE